LLDILAPQQTWCREPNAEDIDSRPASGNAKRDELSPTLAQLGPSGGHRERGQGGGWKVGAKLVSVSSAADQKDSQVLNARVVADQENAAYVTWNGQQTGQELLGVSAIEIILDQDLDLRPEARSDELQRLAGAQRG